MRSWDYLQRRACVTTIESPTPKAWPLSSESLTEIYSLPVQRFVWALAGDAAVTFQTFDPKGLAGDASLNRIFHDILGKCITDLLALNEKGAAVSMVVNQTDGGGRKIENVVGLRAVFVENDEDLRVEPAAPPSIVVIGREDRPHVYFKLRPGEDKARFTGMQKLLSRYYSSDPGVGDLSRCMRMPGFFHWAEGSDVVPKAIYAPTWSKDESGIVRFHEPEPEMLDHVPSDDGFHDVIESDPYIPEYTINDLLKAHGLTENDLTHTATADTPVYVVDDIGVEERIRRAHAYAESIPAAIEGQGGDEHTYKAACKIVRGFDLETSDALPIMEKWNQTCVPPWTSADLRRKVRYAETHGTDPRGYLLDRVPALPSVPVLPPAPVRPEGTQPKYIMSLGEFLDEPDEPVPSYWGDGLLDKGGVLLISGPMQTRKSWFTIQLCLMLAAGKSFLGHEVKEAARILLMECESGRTKYRQRIRKVAAGLGIEPPRDSFFVRNRDAEPPIIGDQLELAVREARANVTVLDTMNNFFIGDENSNTDVQEKVYRHLRSISRRLEWQPSFVLVHHFGKAGKSGDTAPSRGAAMLEQGASCVLHMELKQGLTQITFQKVRDAEKPKSIKLAFGNDFLLREVETDDDTGVKMTEEQRQRFVLCRDFAVKENRPVKSEEFTKLIVENLGTDREIARKSAPDAAKKGFLKPAGKKGFYLPSDETPDGNGMEK